MDLKMLLFKLEIIAVFFIQAVLLAKDTMEFSPYTFQWEDAEMSCARQGQILVPGRRYRAKLIKKWMENEKVESVWLNGWRSVSDITPDADDKLHTLKVDFARPQKKELKMVCQIDSAYYDPLGVAKSTDIAKTICDKDSAVLAGINTEEDVKGVMGALLVDTPYWISSISSQGSKIKQCLVAKRIGDDLKYIYDDCSKENSFICVTDNNLITSFSPLISLKLARYEEFEEEIEKQEQPTVSSLEWYEPSSSMDMDQEVLSTAALIQPTTTQLHFTTTAPPTTTTDVPTTTTTKEPTTTTTKEPTTTATKELTRTTTKEPTTTTTKEPKTTTTKESTTTEVPTTTTTDVPTEETSTAKTSTTTTTEEPVEVTSPEIPVLQSTETQTEVSISEISTEVTTSETLSVSFSEKVREVTTPDIPIELNPALTTTPVKSSVLETSVYEMIHSPKSTSLVDSSEVSTTVEGISYSEMILGEKSIDIGAELIVSQSYSTQEDTSSHAIENVDFRGFSPSSTQQVIDASSVDVQYGETAFIGKTESESTTIPESDSLYKVLPFRTMTLQDRSDASMSKDIQTIHIDTPAHVAEDLTSTEPLALEPTSAVFFMSTSSAMKFMDNSMSDDILDFYGVSESTSSDVGVRTQSSLLGQTKVLELEYTTETQPLIIGTPVIYDQSQFSGYTSSGETQSVSSSIFIKPSTDASVPTFTVSQKEDLMTEYTSSSDASESKHEYDYTDNTFIDNTFESTSDMGILAASESSTPSYECTVIDSTSFCLDTSSATEELGSSTPIDKTMPLTDMIKETTFSSTPSSSYPVFVFDVDEESESSKYHIPISASPTTEQIHSTSKYDDYQYPDETDDDEDEMDQIDTELTGKLDIDENEDENEAENTSVDTEEVVGKKKEKDEGGIEVGLWVAFAILIALVLIALLLALYLYRRRKLQKSKDISTANGAAASGAGAGETVELRDSRSPSRENGKPRDSSTFKDPAYDI